METTFNIQQQIKRRFFAMRNGIVADTLRKGGAGYKIVFGLNLPQIVEISNEFPHDPALAEMLWHNDSTRESLLLAPMLYPAELMDMATAMEWAGDVKEIEVADVLCHRLLRSLPYAVDIARAFISDESPVKRYISLRLMMNLLPEYKEEARCMAEKEMAVSEPLTYRVCAMIKDEADFLDGV